MFRQTKMVSSRKLGVILPVARATRCTCLLQGHRSVTPLLGASVGVNNRTMLHKTVMGGGTLMRYESRGEIIESRVVGDTPDR